MSASLDSGLSSETLAVDEMRRRQALVRQARVGMDSAYSMAVGPIVLPMVACGIIAAVLAKTNFTVKFCEFVYMLAGFSMGAAMVTLWMVVRCRRRIDAVVMILERSISLDAFVNEGGSGRLK